MSHFCVYVFHDEDTSIEDLLAPYDENLELDEPVIKFTREEAIKHCRNDIEEYKNTIYKEFITNPVKYKSEYGHNNLHIKYLEETFPKMLNWTDEECYQYEANGYETDEDGNILTNYNPKSKWDWYEVGGRWSGIIPNNEIKVNDIDVKKIDTPYAIVTPDGEWIERGQMGWWGMSSNDIPMDEWENKFKEYIKSLDKNLILTQVDCHI